MNAMEMIIKDISREIDALEEDELGGVILDESLPDVPPPDDFLDPEPDVYVEDIDDANIERLSQETIVLGIYIAMHSPGRIVLFSRNIRWFYWSLVKTVKSRVPYMTKLDLHGALQLVTMHTYQHELFHYYVNILREIFSSRFDPLLEEALAVAWARHSIQGQRATWNTQIGRMNGLFYSLLMKQAFAFRSPGYRDWILYADDNRFKPALVDYMAPGNFRKLQGNGVDMEHLIYGMLGQCRGGLVERVL